MKVMSSSQPVTFPEVQRDQIIGGLPIQRDLEGPICAHCGSRRYLLFFRVTIDGRNGVLAGQCSRCRNPTKLTVNEIEGVWHA